MTGTRTVLDAHDYLLRCRDLERRGLHKSWVDEIRAAGSVPILAAFERCTDDQLRQINAHEGAK